LVDFVILHRKRYLSEVGLEKEHDEIFKSLKSNKTLSDIQEIINA